MLPAQGAPTIPYIFLGNTYEGPTKREITIGIQYEGNQITRKFLPEKTIEDIVDEVSVSLGYHCYLRSDYKKFNVFIGRQKISMKRELGYYRNLLRANNYRMRIERKLDINIVKREIIRDYNHEDIQNLMKFLTTMDPIVEQAEEGEKAAYEDYQKAK